MRFDPHGGAEFVVWVRTQRPQLEAENIKRSDDVSGFQVLARCPDLAFILDGGVAQSWQV